MFSIAAGLLDLHDLFHLRNRRLVWLTDVSTLNTEGVQPTYVILKDECMMHCVSFQKNVFLRISPIAKTPKCIYVHTNACLVFSVVRIEIQALTVLRIMFRSRICIE